MSWIAQLVKALARKAKGSAHSPTFPSIHLRHSSFSSRSVALPTSQLILQPFRSFTYVTAHYPTILSLFLRHRLFTYVSWRAAHVIQDSKLISLRENPCPKMRGLASMVRRSWDQIVFVFLIHAQLISNQWQDW